MRQSTINYIDWKDYDLKKHKIVIKRVYPPEGLEARARQFNNADDFIQWMRIPLIENRATDEQKEAKEFLSKGDHGWFTNAREFYEKACIPLI